MDETYRKIGIGHDMTVEQRKKPRELVETAKEKEKTDGGFLYRVKRTPGDPQTNPKNISREYREVEFGVVGFKLLATNFMVNGGRGIFCYVKDHLIYKVANLNDFVDCVWKHFVDVIVSSMRLYIPIGVNRSLGTKVKFPIDLLDNIKKKNRVWECGGDI
ncbi:hypothetical protein HELRODRAFT_176191 [Helobdella robusta]|uniref:Uncharacterized protein n=1 Tax=Helobdella robusta TaxID=6412 RepID=T1FAA2_HELRO|nr:hypothetical protein HELRODRAFT_176191 [Helobdella robusta]ESO00322.1 hypothetical protein HELRODRAFT_176191 [Helobdella robusta]